MFLAPHLCVSRSTPLTLQTRNISQSTSSENKYLKQEFKTSNKTSYQTRERKYFFV